MPCLKRFIPEEAKLWTDQKGRPIAVVEVTTPTIQGRWLFLPAKRWHNPGNNPTFFG